VKIWKRQLVERERELLYPAIMWGLIESVAVKFFSKRQEKKRKKKG